MKFGIVTSSATKIAKLHNGIFWEEGKNSIAIHNRLKWALDLSYDKND